MVRAWNVLTVRGPVGRRKEATNFPEKPSPSSLLENRRVARQDEIRAALEKATTDYYSSPGAAEVQEQSEWGQFAAREFPSDVV